MKTSTGRRSRASQSAASNGAADHAPSPLVQFAADRAHDAADALYEQAKLGIDRAQRAVTSMQGEGAWDRMQPLLVGAAGFVRHYPLRAAAVVALLASAFFVTRTA